MQTPPSILFVAGEPSGDLHASLLCRALLSKTPSARLFAVGGTHLRNAGADVLFDISRLSVMGFVEPLRQVRRLILLAGRLIQLLHVHRVEVVILIDFPGFNLPLSALIRRFCPPVTIVYLSPPQVWAWRPGRLEKLRRRCDLVFPLFEFEHRLYTTHALHSVFFGHLLSDQLRARKYPENADENQGVLRILLLPGSRPQEVGRLLPVMMDACRMVGRRVERPVEAYLLPHPNLPPEIYRPLAQSLAEESNGCRFIFLQDEPWTKPWHIALSKPGTVNLELADAGIPFVVTYRTSPLTYWIAKKVVRTAHVSLVNLLSERPLVPELLQSAATPANIADAAVAILKDNDLRLSMRQSLRQVSRALSPPKEQSVADRMADAILGLNKKAMI